MIGSVFVQRGYSVLIGWNEISENYNDKKYRFDGVLEKKKTPVYLASIDDLNNNNDFLNPVALLSNGGFSAVKIFDN